MRNRQIGWTRQKVSNIGFFYFKLSLLMRVFEVHSNILCLGPEKFYPPLIL